MKDQEKFLEYYKKTTKVLEECSPKGEYGYNKEISIYYGDMLYNVLDTFKFYFDNMLKYGSYSKNTREYIKKHIDKIKEQVLGCKHDFKKLSNLYYLYFSSISEEDELNENSSISDILNYIKNDEKEKKR